MTGVAPQDDRVARWNRIIALRQMRRLEEAVAEAGRLSAAFPEVAEVRHLLALCLYDLGDLEAARTQAREALRLDPDNLGCLKMYATVAPTFAEGRDLMRRAYAMAPDDPNVLVNLAVFEHRTGARRKVWRRYANRALELAPQEPDILATVSSLEGGTSSRRGRQLVRDALAVDPHHPRALEVTVKGASSVQEIRQASVAVAAALATDPTNPELLRSGHHLVKGLHAVIVVLSVMVEGLFLVMCTVGSPPAAEVSGYLVYGMLWVMILAVAMLTSVMMFISLGRHARAFLRSFYGAFPVKRATIRATLVLVPLQVVLIMATGSRVVVAWVSGLSLLTMTVVFIRARTLEARRRAQEEQERSRSRAQFRHL